MGHFMESSAPASTWLLYRYRTGLPKLSCVKHIPSEEGPKGMSSRSIVETLVEPLVLTDERDTSRDLLPNAVASQESQIKTHGLTLEPRMEETAVMIDDDEEELGDEVAATIASVVSRDMIDDPRVTTTLQLLAEPLTEKLDANEANTPEDEPKVDKIPNNESELIGDAGIALAVTEAIPDPLVRETSSSPATDSEHELAPITPGVISELQVYLRSQIVENQISSHAKEIHEFLCSRIPEKQLNNALSKILHQLSLEFYEESVAHNQREVSVDIQSSLCLLEQMFLTIGRRSPLQDMYTEEEEELLDQLATPTYTVAR